MSMEFRRLTRRIGVVAAACGLAAGAMVLTASSVTASAGGSKLVVDNFLCYTSSQSGLKPMSVSVTNALGSSSASFGHGYSHCNSADESYPVSTQIHKAIAVHPLSNLGCYAVSGGASATASSAILQNQFGDATMKVDHLEFVCLPTWSSNVGPVTYASDTPPDVNAFACYGLTKVSTTYGFRPTGNIRAADQFSDGSYVPLSIGVADIVCAPTSLSGGTSSTPKSGSNGTLESLTCFPTSPTLLGHALFDENGFGQGAVTATTSGEQYCLPTTLTA